MFSPRTSLVLWDRQTSVGEMKQRIQIENCPWCWTASDSQYSGSAGSLCVKYVVLKCANGPCAQSTSFLDGRGVLAVYPTVSLAPIVSGSALVLWIGEAGGGNALWKVPQAQNDIKEGHWKSQSWQAAFKSRKWIEKIWTKINSLMILRSIGNIVEI